MGIYSKLTRIFLFHFTYVSVKDIYFHDITYKKNYNYDIKFHFISKSTKNTILM